MTVASIEHIEIDDTGIARIVGKRTKVIQIVMDRMANGWTPEEIHAQYPHLSLAQIHAAFAYYYDHQEELDAAIERDLQEADSLRSSAGDTPAVHRLRQSGKLA
jgi:uncharacterized protein (DUF433 family)